MEETTQKKGTVKRVVLIVLILLLSLFILTAAVAMIYLNHLLNQINRVDPELEYTLSSSEAEDFLETDPDLVPTEPGSSETYPDINDIIFPTYDPNPTQPSLPDHSIPTDPTEPSTQPTEPAPQIYGDHLVNILLVGQDRREGQGRQRSDTMILVSFNKSDSTITLTSFMRDMYVQIPGYKPNRLNAAYAFGGMKLLYETMELNFGVKIDGMVEVDFSGFTTIIQRLGGVTVMLNEAEAKYLNDLYEAKFLDSPVVVGQNRLDAKQAQVYVQLREIDSDYHRTERQREVISSLIQDYKDQPLDQMLVLLEDLLPYVTTDLSNTQILGYAMDLFPMLTSSQINTLRLPLNGTYQSGLVHIREGFYAWLQYNIDFAANREALFEIFRDKG